jgi:hypothetical protein
MGAAGDGCAAASKADAPDVVGWWDISYADNLDVKITLGGAAYEATLGAEGGAVTIDHNGQPFTFDLDCTKPEVLCPSEAWPASIKVEQRNAKALHQMQVTLPTQTCEGTLRAAVPAECGAETDNPDCDDVCEGTVTTKEEERLGVIGEDGKSFRLFLGAGLVSNGVNCALLGVSVADADLVATGGPSSETWTATAMTNGVVTVGYTGACLWAGDVTGDGQIEALAVGASVTFATGFTGARR